MRYQELFVGMDLHRDTIARGTTVPCVKSKTGLLVEHRTVAATTPDLEAWRDRLPATGRVTVGLETTSDWVWAYRVLRERATVRVANTYRLSAIGEGHRSARLCVSARRRAKPRWIPAGHCNNGLVRVHLKVISISPLWST